MTRPAVPDVVRHVVVAARRETVFRFFTDSSRFARWWGEGSQIDPRPGGEVFIHYPGGAVARGVVEELVPLERVVFTFGYDRPGAPIPPGGSTVVVTFEDAARGTLVTLRHTELPSEAVARDHVQGWRYQLSVLAKVASDEQHAGAAATVDAWFAAWSEPDAVQRRARLASCAAPDVRLRDDFSCLEGLEDVEVHAGAAQVHMPGLRLERAGEPRVVQGAALVRWQAVRTSDGSVAARGTNIFELGGDGHITSVVGFWNA